jgi:prephenate dehydratase
VSDKSGPLLTYLGPAGSFTHAAVNLLGTPWTGAMEPRASVPDVIFSVESGEAAAGVVPLETSVEGDVSSTVDELIFRSSMCFINEELIVPINYVVAGMAGARIDEVNRLVTTTSAMAQCRRFLEAINAQVTLVESAAAACEVVAELGVDSAAALTTAEAAKMNGLAVMRGVAEDYSGISTRMALLTRRIQSPTGHDRTALVVTPTGDRTGVLGDILECFSDRDIALTSISSRPLRTRTGEYSFLLTARGHLADERVQDAIQVAAALPAEIKILGSYPLNPDSTDRRVAESAPPGSVDAATLPDWIDTLLTPEQIGT